MKYIIYCRKSTDTDDKQVQSLDSQESELTRLAEAQGLQVVGVLRESMSAKSEGRPIFKQVLDMIVKGKADGIICWKLDRLARNMIDGGKIMDMLGKGVIKEIRTFEATHLPSDNVLMLAVHFGMADQFVRDLRSNVKRGNRAKLEHGGWPSRAPLGYVNDKGTKTVQINKEHAKYVVKAFELYATGSYGLQDITDILYTDGFRTKTGKKIYRNQIQRLLLSSFSAGIMESNGKYYEGNHTPLISKALYDKVQNVMHNRSRPRPQKHFFPLRGFLSCETCGCALTASLKKGHQYYYCTNGKGQCEEHKSYLREQALYDTIAGILGNLKLSDRKIELMYNSAKERTGANTYTEQALATLQSHLESLKTKESKLLDTFLAEQITKELYDEKSREISNDKISTKKQIKELELKQPKFTLEPVKKIFKQASASQKDFLEGDEAKKREVVEELLWNLSLKDKKVASIKYKSPFHLLENVPKNADFSLLCTQ